MVRFWWLAVFSVWAGFAFAEQYARPAFDYILWDGHRFSRTEEEHERDFRWYKDLGFTHSFLGNASEEAPLDGARIMVKLAENYGLSVGLRLHFHRELAAFGKCIGLSKEQMIENGVLLSKNESEGVPPYNPVHPAVIKYYASGFAKAVDQCLSFDTGHRLKLFLIGTEMGWPFPKNRDHAYPRAVEILEAAAREDGVLRQGEEARLEALENWWSGPHEKGGDWRLRRAIEAEILRRIPDADFMVDPIWAVKIVNGFGGTWTYVQDEPLRIADAFVRLKAMTRPDPAAQGVQLIRISNDPAHVHDALLTSCLTALCMGADKLYHWGINTFEPGLYPYYRFKGEHSPEGFPWFKKDHIEDWGGFVSRLIKAADSSLPYRPIWDSLDKEFRDELEEEGTMGDVEDAGDTGVADELQDSLLKSLNHVLTLKNLWKEQPKVVTRSAERVQGLWSRRNELEGEDLAELNRLIIEALFPGAMRQTASPNIRELLEGIRRKRETVEPAIRTTGRLLSHFDHVFAEWKLMEPRVAVLGGIYGSDASYQALIVGHLPFDVLRNQDDRRARLSSYRYVAVAASSVSLEDYADLERILAAGGEIFLPEGFKPPEGQPALKGAIPWSPKAEVKSAASFKEQKKNLYSAARKVCSTFRDHGFQPYFDTDSPGVVMQAFVYRGRPVLFVVNHRREETMKDEKATGFRPLPAEIEILVRDHSKGLQVFQLDTVGRLALSEKPEGFIFRDTIEPAWFRLYAVLKEGETWSFSEPFPTPPGIKELSAEPKPGGIEVKWQVAVDDWVGSDVQSFVIHRSKGGGAATPIGETYGRTVSGPGGLVTSFLDKDVQQGETYAYQVQVVSPLHCRGPFSQPVSVKSFSP